MTPDSARQRRLGIAPSEPGDFQWSPLRRDARREAASPLHKGGKGF
jgi:hypothetical protein